MSEDNEPKPKGDWMQTYRGNVFYPFSPEYSNVSVIDIIHSMSMMGRFNSHTKYPYSVGQHTLLVVRESKRICENDYSDSALISLYAQLGAWLHDASESLGLGDLIRPVKHMKEMSAYREVQHTIEADLRSRFRISETMWEAVKAIVKEADEVALATEARDAMNTPDKKWGLRATPAPDMIEPMTYGTVKVELWNELHRICYALDEMEFFRHCRVGLLRDEAKSYIKELASEFEEGSLWKRKRHKLVVSRLELGKNDVPTVRFVTEANRDNIEKPLLTFPLFLWQEYIPSDGKLVPRYRRIA